MLERLEAIAKVCRHSMSGRMIKIGKLAEDAIAVGTGIAKGEGRNA